SRQPRQRRHALSEDTAVRRHAVIGLAIPGRELQHGQVGGKKFQRPTELVHARAIAADHRKADSRRLGARSNGPREIRDDQALGTFGNVGKGQRAAGGEQLRRRLARLLHSRKSSGRNALIRSKSALPSWGGSGALEVSAAYRS